MNKTILFVKKHLLLFVLVFGIASIFMIGRSELHFQAHAFSVKNVRSILRHKFRSVCDIPILHVAHCHAKVATDDALTPLAGGAPYASSFGPVQFHTAYQLPCTPGGPVASACSTPENFGPTIAIVDAFHTPTLASDLAAYSTYFGIPNCTKTNGCLTILNENGGTNLPTHVDPGWSLEASLDIDTAHTICQTCKILFLEASSNSYFDLGTAVNTAANLGAVAISNSYGGPEWSGEANYNSYYNHPGIAVTASSGDSGYGAEFPAAYSNVVAVGGTTLQLFTDNTYAAESVWGSAGSGCSAYESASALQMTVASWNNTNCILNRSIADIAADADPNTGAAVYDTTTYNGQTGWFQVGGTSLSAPLIAAVYALSGVAPLANASDILYQNSGMFHDITTGSNGSCTNGVICTAGLGYDGPTGLGTPNGLAGFGFLSVSPTATPTPIVSLTPTISPTPTLTPTLTMTPTPTPADTIPPTVSITNPTNGSTVRRGNTITIRATASDNVKVTKVEFYINGVLRSTDSTSPYTASWNVPSQRNVKYTLTAKAYDVAGNTASATIQVTSN